MKDAVFNQLRCFKAYDVRGVVPDELNEDLAARIGRAFAALYSPARVVVGHDIRLSSPALAAALISGLLAAGVDVLDLGECCTEEVYFAVFHLGRQGRQRVDGGIMVTASHNPAAYNGMKFVRQDARPVSCDNGLLELEKLARSAAPGQTRGGTRPGRLMPLDIRPAYIDHLLGYIEPTVLKPLTLVVNSGNGCAGAVIDLLAERLPFNFVRIHHEPYGTFPNGVPNPLLPENRETTTLAVQKHGAALGIAWDGDADRCFLFDETGGFIEGYYMVGLLAQSILAKRPGAKIIHDPRLIWNTRELVVRAGGIPVMSRTGHAFIKEKMRLEDAAYGGEMSAHHYFRDFAYCDSGMIPWLLVCEMLCRSGRPLSALVRARLAAYPVSGEINSSVADPDGVIERIAAVYGEEAGGEKDYTDGLSLTFKDFRFNVRKSNTEPVLRLNVETRGDVQLLRDKTQELLDFIRA